MARGSVYLFFGMTYLTSWDECVYIMTCYLVLLHHFLNNFCYHHVVLLLLVYHIIPAISFAFHSSLPTHTLLIIVN